MSVNITDPIRKPARAGWATRAERSNMFALRFMALASLRLGRGPARGMLYLIAAYFLLFSPEPRQAVADWLRRVRGPGGAPVRLRDLFRHFLSFASVVHDRIFLVNGQSGMFDIRVHGQELVSQAGGPGRGLMLMGAHVGSFEVMRALGDRHAGVRVAMAMYKENAQKINQLLAAINPRAAIDVVALGQVESMLQLHGLLEAGAIVGMLGDRVLGDDATRTIEFFGAPAAFPTGPFRMAAIARRPVIFMVGLYRGGNRYDVHIEQLADFSSIPAGGRQAAVDAAMDRYAVLLEKYARIAPENWFNFYDFWHPQGPA